MQYAIELSRPSTAARAILGALRFRVVIPCSAPAAAGRFGDRSPSKYGTSVSPPAPACADNANRSSSSKSTPSIVAMAASTGAPLSVQTSGSCRPVASAKPATMPSGSCGATSPTALTTPDVPSETTQSPGSAPSPRAAPALSPAPGPNTAPVGVLPRLLRRTQHGGDFGPPTPHRQFEQIELIVAGLRLRNNRFRSRRFGRCADRRYRPNRSAARSASRAVDTPPPSHRRARVHDRRANAVWPR